MVIILRKKEGPLIEKALSRESTVRYLTILTLNFAWIRAVWFLRKYLSMNKYHAHNLAVLLQEEYAESKTPVGIDLSSGEALVPADSGIWDNYRVKRQLLHSW